MQNISLKTVNPPNGSSSSSSSSASSNCCSNDPDEVTDSSPRRIGNDLVECGTTPEDRRARAEAEGQPVDTAPAACRRSSSPDEDAPGVSATAVERAGDETGAPAGRDTGCREQESPGLLAGASGAIEPRVEAERQPPKAPAIPSSCSAADGGTRGSAADVAAEDGDLPPGDDGGDGEEGGGVASQETTPEEGRVRILELERPPPDAASASDTAPPALETAVSKADIEAAAKAEEERGEEEEDDDDGDGFDWGAAKHIFVLSSAGKPVFSLSGDEQQLSTLMGLIQALLSLCTDCDSGDELESISAGSRRFVFLKRGNLVLVAVSSPSTSRASNAGSDGDSGGGAEEEEEEEEGEGGEEPECESFMRLQLEYLYASILFLLTSKFQGMFSRTPGYDLRGLLDGADTSLRGIVQLAEPRRGRGRMLAGGVETVWMDPAIRSRVAKALQSAQAVSATSGALYAIWLCGEKLVSLAQPRAPSHRLTSRDLLLLVNFVATQPALRNGESWTPVCFPRFQETGYLYAYVAFLDDSTGAAPPSAPPETTASQNQDPSLTGDDSGGGGSDRPSTENGAQPAVPGASNPGGSSRRAEGGEAGFASAEGASCVVLVSVDASSEQFQAFRRTRSALESRFRSALGTHWDRYLGPGAAVEREGILAKFCSQMKALHFYYCLRGKQGGAPCVTQCLSSPFVHPELAKDTAAQHRIWGYYTRAALRLRCGSSQEGRVFCREGGGGETGRSSGGLGGGRGGEGGAAAAAPPGEKGKAKTEPDSATMLFESDPEHSLAYEIGEKVTVMSLFGQRDGSGRG
ncbi:unnamed protein product, partial [Scytosiphon promiscuus]